MQRERHAQRRPPSRVLEVTARRPVIVHFHIFKNAGSSVDAALAESFGSAWLAHDPGPPGVWKNVPWVDVAAILAARPDVSAVSSHQLRWPTSDVTDAAVIPIVFVRHPIDRAASIYRYLVGIKDPQAVGRSISEYFEWMLSEEGSFVARSFQTLFLSDDQRLIEANGDLRMTQASESHLRQATGRLHTLPFVGIVELYTQSVNRLNTLVAPAFHGMELRVYHANRSTSDDRPLSDRVEEIANAVSGRTYRRLVQANEADLQLYAEAVARFRAE
jgi:Sulfotransferase family